MSDLSAIIKYELKGVIYRFDSLKRARTMNGKFPVDLPKNEND